MKNFLLAFFVFLLWALFGMWYYTCNIKGLCKDNSEITQNEIELKAKEHQEILRKKAYDDSIAASRLQNGLFARNINGEIIFNYDENLKITSKDSSVYIPDKISDFSTKIADYMGTHQNEELIIEGFENLYEKKQNRLFGKYRADQIKKLLIDAGINGDRIISKAKTVEYAYSDEATYNGGISLVFGPLDTSRLAEVEKGIANKILYCEFGQNTFKPDATLSNYALELKNYLLKYPNKKVTIIGHTDDVGEIEDNLWIGQQRADHVLKYLKSQEIDISKLSSSSKGESAPMIPNTSKENRAKNRRIEIIVN